MKINKSECVKIITTIKAQCTESLQYKNDSEFEMIVEVWFEILKEYEKELVWLAVRNALKNSVYQKQNWIGAICQEIEKIQSTREKTVGELWVELTHALNSIAKIMYFGTARHWVNGALIDPTEEAEKIYIQLDPILQDYAGGLIGLVELSKQENFEYEKGRFQKSVEILKNRRKTKKETENFFQLLGNASVTRIGEKI